MVFIKGIGWIKVTNFLCVWKANSSDMYTIFCFLQSGLYLKTILEQDVFLGKFTLIYVWKTVVKKLQASYRNYIVVYQLSPIHRTTLCLSVSLAFFSSFLFSSLFFFLPPSLSAQRQSLYIWAWLDFSKYI